MSAKRTAETAGITGDNSWMKDGTSNSKGTQKSSIPQPTGIRKPFKFVSLNSDAMPIDRSSPLSAALGSRDRMRVSKACDHCKRRKTKCDGSHPCGTCVKNNWDCQYTVKNNPRADNGVSLSAFQTPEPKAVPAVPASGLDSILHRVQAEAHGQSDLSLIKDDSQPHDNRSELTLLEFDLLHENGVPIHKGRYSRMYNHLLTNKLGLEMYTSLPPLTRGFVSIPRIQAYGWNMSGMHYVKPRYIQVYADLVDEQTGIYLIKYFFVNVNPLFAILHKPVFWKQFEMFQKDKTKPELRLFSALYHMVCAIAMRFSEVSERRQYEAGLEERLFDDSYKALQDFSFEWESVEIIQGWLLAFLYLRICHRQSSAWNALGYALRMCLGMGLMKIVSLRHESDYDILKRTRTFWCCFTMDRILGIEMGRPFTLIEDNIEISIPDKYVDDGWLTPPAFGLIRLGLCLCGLRKNAGLTTPVTESTFLLLKEWNESMEELSLGDNISLRSNNVYPPPLLAQFRLFYHSALKFIFTRSLFGLVAMKWNLPNRYLNEFLNSAEEIVSLCQDLSELKCFTCPWWLFLSGIHGVGIMSILQMKCGLSMEIWGPRLKIVIDLISILVDDGRFFMSKECLWSLKNLNHMLILNSEYRKSILESAGIDHGEPISNRNKFTAMGRIDEYGNEVPPLVSPDTTDQKSTPAGDTSAKSTPKNDQPQPNTGQWTQMQGYLDGSSNQSLSLDWFENWSWDVESSMASYFAYQEDK